MRYISGKWRDVISSSVPAWVHVTALILPALVIVVITVITLKFGGAWRDAPHIPAGAQLVHLDPGSHASSFYVVKTGRALALTRDKQALIAPYITAMLTFGAYFTFGIWLLAAYAWQRAHQEYPSLLYLILAIPVIAFGIWRGTYYESVMLEPANQVVFDPVANTVSRNGIRMCSFSALAGIHPWETAGSGRYGGIKAFGLDATCADGQDFSIGGPWLMPDVMYGNPPVGRFLMEYVQEEKAK